MVQQGYDAEGIMQSSSLPVENGIRPEDTEETPLIPQGVFSNSQRKKKLYYFCFLFLGLGTLLPWNFFITADSYWQYKLRNETSSNETTELQVLYNPMLVSFSQITNFSFLFINALFSHMLSHKKRIYASLMFMILFFTVTTAMTKVDSDDWQLAFFISTMVIVVGISASGAVFQGGLMGVAGMFPETYMCAVTGGQSLGGIFASLARILSLCSGTSAVTAAFIFFLIAVGVMVLTFLVYVYLASTSFFKRHYLRNRVTRESLQRASASDFLREHLRIFKEIRALGLSICFVLLVTLSVFPVVVVRVTSVYDNQWTKIYFQPVFTFLLFNTGDYLGRQVSGFMMWPKKGSRMIVVLALLRVVFIPLFLLCNHSAESLIPSVFTHDAWYIVFMIFFSLSNGYLFSICMMYAPRMVSEEYAEKAGTMMAAMIGLGLLIGAGMAFCFALIS